MQIHEYQANAMLTAKNLPREKALLHAICLLADELGELASTIKKAEVYNQPWDFDNVEEELGDALWGIAYTAYVFGMSLETCARQNLVKLQKRYPDGYSDEKAAQRLDKISAPSGHDSGEALV